MGVFIRFFQIGAQFLYQLLRFSFLSLWLVLNPLSLANKEKKQRKINRTKAICFTDFFRNLGATFIKIGQILSTRPDILPPYMIEELSKLQDQVPPFPIRDVHRIIEADFDKSLLEIFEEFDEQPLAAASISQVHKAKVKGFGEVAVKIQRPDIETKMHEDLKIICAFADVLSDVPGISNVGLDHLAEQFSKSILMQLDFSKEIKNNWRFNKNFQRHDYISVPNIVAECCSKHVITMSYVKGKKLSDVLENPPLDRNLMAERLFTVYMDMAFRDYFLHADMHPGNILVDENGNYILIDTGLVYEIPEHYITKFFKVAFAFLTLDGALIAEAYLDGQQMSEEQRQSAIADSKQMSKKYVGMDLTDIEMGSAMMEIFSLLRKHHIYLDSEWSGMILSDMTFEGLAKMLAEDFDVLGFMNKRFPEYMVDNELIPLDDPIVGMIVEKMMKQEVGHLGEHFQKRWIKPGLNFYLKVVSHRDEGVVGMGKTGLKALPALIKGIR